jgi:hypothetical protein
MNDVDASASELKVGDEVEFSLSIQRNGKSSAIRVKKLVNLNSAQNESQAKRPDRLITKLKTTNIDDKNGKQLILVRQPKNPDGKIKSFGRQLVERLPGISENTTSPQTTVPTTPNNNTITHFNNLITSNAI